MKPTLRRIGRSIALPRWECEQAFFNLPLVVAEDLVLSAIETRYYVLGQTDAGRRLFLALPSASGGFASFRRGT